MKHLNIRVSGKVQGVFFRASAKERAEQLGVKGFVRNVLNNEVYIEAEGEEETLQLFLNWCARGPSRAQVENVKAEESPLENFVVFEIRK